MVSTLNLLSLAAHALTDYNVQLLMDGFSSPWLSFHVYCTIVQHNVGNRPMFGKLAARFTRRQTDSDA